MHSGPTTVVVDLFLAREISCVFTCVHIMIHMMFYVGMDIVLFGSVCFGQQDRDMSDVTYL